MTTNSPRSRLIAAAPGVLIALLGTVAVAAARQLLAPLLAPDLALSLFLIVVAAATAVGGLGTGVLAVVLALTASAQTVFGPGHLILTSDAWIPVGAFLVEALTISVLFRLLQRRSAHLSTVLADLHAQRRLVERMAMEDSLTGLGNHRALRGEIARHVEFAAREGLTLTVVCADVDGLKATNDTYGHGRGDQLLSGMARLLVENCRTSDTAYRIGGDEFVVLLPGTGPAGYTSWERRFDGLSAGMREEFDGAGLSLGAAHFPTDGDSPDALLSIADKRMYAAKIAHAHPRVVGPRRTTETQVEPARPPRGRVPMTRVLSDVAL